MSREIFSPRPEVQRIFVLASSPSNRRGVVLVICPSRRLRLVMRVRVPFLWFHLTVVTALFVSETRKLDGCKIGNHGPIGDSWPIALLGYPRGHRVFIETECVMHTGLARRRILTLEPERLKNPTEIRHGNTQDGTDSLPETLKLLAFSDVWRRSPLLSSR
jgi:hypothetical protein